MVIVLDGVQLTRSCRFRPIGDIGTIFRKYPEQWQVYIQDEEAPGRFRKIADRPQRPAGASAVHVLFGLPAHILPPYYSHQFTPTCYPARKIRSLYLSGSEQNLRCVPF